MVECWNVNHKPHKSGNVCFFNNFWATKGTKMADHNLETAWKTGKIPIFRHF